MDLKSRLISQNSNLRLLKFGKDLQGGGNSNQPYITTPLPGVEEPLSPNSPDYILRQGVLERIVDDETRFFKYFTSTKGLAFIGKQNTLSLSSVRTQASQGPINQGVYLPTNTSAQLAANPFGGHLNFLGVDPTGLIGGIQKYGEVVKFDQTVKDNRLVSLSKDLGFIGLKPEAVTPDSRLGRFLQSARTFLSNGKTVLFSYNGGPGATQGIGKTNIYRYSQSPTNLFPDEGPGTYPPIGVSNAWFDNTGLLDSISIPELTPDGGITFEPLHNVSVYKSGSLDTRSNLNTYLVGKPTHGGLEELKEKRFDEESFLKVTNGVSDTYNQLTNFSLSQATDDYYGVVAGSSSPTLRKSFSVYKSGSLEERDNLKTHLVGKQYTSDSNKQSPLGALNDYFTKGFGENLESPNAQANIALNAGLVEFGDNINTPTNSRTVYKDGTFQSTETGKTPQTQGNVWSQNDIINYTDNNPKYYNGGLIQDFRNILRNNLTSPNSSVLSNSPNYSSKNYESRTYLGKPGRKNKNIISYSSGTGEGPLDQINALPIYQSTTVDTTKPINDLVKFRIASVNNDDPTTSVNMHFRAFINDFSDNYTADWSGEKYPGRGEEFYRYNGFGRSISLSWNVYAQSKEELIPMYKKLNYLASTLMPDYSNSGYMRGNLVKLTVGGYLYEQWGIIKSLNYVWDMDAPFEIGINDVGDYDPSVKELPFSIKVNSFNFTPIHTFLPQKQKNTYNGSGGEVSEYGPERYIALKASNDNYN
jgi:hypothetical protein